MPWGTTPAPGDKIGCWSGLAFAASLATAAENRRIRVGCAS